MRTFRQRIFIILFLLEFLIAGCEGAANKVSFQSNDAEPIEASNLILIPINDTKKVKLKSGLMPFKYEVESGGASITETGILQAPAYLTEGIVKVTDGGGQVTKVPYLVASKPQIFVESNLVPAGESAVLRVAGGVEPYGFSIATGEGTIDAKGVFRAGSRAGVVTISAKDYLGSQTIVSMSVVPKLSLAQKRIDLSVSASVTLAAGGARGALRFEIIAGTGSVNSSTGEFTAPTSNGLTLVKIFDEIGNYAVQEIQIEDGSPPVMAFFPSTADIGEEQELFLALNGGAGGASITKVLNASDAIIGPGTLDSTSQVATFRAGSGMAVAKQTTIRASDVGGAWTEAIVNTNPLPSIQSEELRLVANKSVTKAISGGLGSYSVFADNGLATLSGANVTVQASKNEGLSHLIIRDGIGQKKIVPVVTVPELKLYPSEVQLDISAKVLMSPRGGQAPYTYRILNLNGEPVDSPGLYGSIEEDGTYQAPVSNVDIIIEVTDSQSTPVVSKSRISVNSYFSIAPSYATLSANENLDVEVKLGVGEVTARILGSSAGLVITKQSDSSFRISAPSSISSMSEVLVEFADIRGFKTVSKYVLLPALSLEVTGVLSDTLAVNNVAGFQILGGKPPYKVTPILNGKGSLVTTQNNLGEVNAVLPGTFELRVTDAASNTVSRTITVSPKLQIDPASSYLSFGELKVFNVTGGVGAIAAVTLKAGTGALGFTPGDLFFNYEASKVPEVAIIEVKDSLDNRAELRVRNREPNLRAEIAGQPALFSNDTTLNVVVSGTDVTHYRYAVVNTTMPCALAVYGTAIDIATPITGNIGADGAYRLCVRGIDAQGVIQPSGWATRYDWMKDSVDPTIAISTPASGAFVSLANQAAFGISGTSSESSGNVQLNVTVVGSTNSRLSIGSTGAWSGSLDLTSSAEGHLVLNASITDKAGNNSSTATVAVIKDTVSPTAPQNIEDGFAFSSISSSPVIRFKNGTDTSSGLQKHQLRLLRLSNSQVVKDWFDFTSGSQVTGLSLTEGQSYKVEVRAHDLAGNISTVTASDGWIVDQTPPTVPTLFNDGTLSEDLSSSPRATWTAATDAASGISHYEMSIGTTLGGTQTLDWTSVGNETSASLSGMVLNNGAKYYSSIRAVDKNGLKSAAVNGDGWTISSNGHNIVLAPFDGAEGSVNFLNMSVMGRPFQAINAPKLTVAQSRFGGASGDFSAGYIKIPSSSQNAIGNKNFTIEFWARHSSLGASSTYAVRGTGWYISLGKTADTKVVMGWNNQAGPHLNVSSAAIATNTWNHISVSRVGTDIYSHINGTLVNTVTVASNLEIEGGSSTPEIFVGEGGMFIDDLRITIGKTNHSNSNFTPTQNPKTLMLMNFEPKPLVPSARNILYMSFDGNAGSSQFRNLGVTGELLTNTGTPVMSTTATKFGGAHADLSSGNLSTVDSSAYIVGANDFSIEFWVKHSGLGVTSSNVIKGANWSITLGNSGTNDKPYMNWNGEGSASAGSFELNSSALSTNTWNHISVTRLGHRVYSHINGVLTNSVVVPNSLSLEGTATTSALVIGEHPVQIDDLILASGVARRNLDNFTPGQQAYSLVHMPMDGANGSTTFSNLANNGNEFTGNSGTPALTEITSVYGSSALDLYSGTVASANSAQNKIGTKDFTLEFWVNYSGMGFFGTHVIRGAGWSISLGSGGYTSLASLYWNGEGDHWGGSFGIPNPYDVNSSITPNVWNHISITRSGTKFLAHLNGELVNAGDVSPSLSLDAAAVTSQIVLGEHPCLIDDLSLVVGVARRGMENFTPHPITNGVMPVVPFNAKALMKNLVFDKDQFTNTGSPSVSGIIKKNGQYVGDFRTGSMETPVSSDYVIGTKDFTFEFWVRHAGVDFFSTPVIGGTGWSISLGNAGYNPNAQMYWSNQGDHWGGPFEVAPAPIAVNTWNHIAISRKGTRIYSHLNGVLAATADVDANLSLEAGSATSYLKVYGIPGGYLDDLILTIGDIRYKEQNISIPVSPYLY
jgi:hypothetical protein